MSCSSARGGDRGGSEADARERSRSSRADAGAAERTSGSRRSRFGRHRRRSPMPTSSIEAVFEDMDVKREVIAKIGWTDVARPGRCWRIQHQLSRHRPARARRAERRSACSACISSLRRIACASSRSSAARATAPARAGDRRRDRAPPRQGRRDRRRLRRLHRQSHLREVSPAGRVPARGGRLAAAGRRRAPRPRLRHGALRGVGPFRPRHLLAQSPAARRRPRSARALRRDRRPALRARPLRPEDRHAAGTSIPRGPRSRCPIRRCTR